MIRYVNDFENYAVGDTYKELGYDTDNVCLISEIAGKKVCKGSGGVFTQSILYSDVMILGNYTWNVCKLFTKIDPGTFMRVLTLRSLHLNSYINAYLDISPADGNKLKCTSYYISGGVWTTQTTILNVVADSQFHDCEIRMGKEEVYFRCGAETSTHAIPTDARLARYTKAIWMWGATYVAYIDRHLIDQDIYGLTDTSKMLIDGVGVSGIFLYLWDTTGSVPDYTLTTGTGGSIDFSTVADGTYKIGGKDARGYCVFGEITISSGVPV